MQNNNIHSDLAVEITRKLQEGLHYKREYYNDHGIKVEQYHIMKKHPDYNHGIGNYIELSFDNYLNQENIIKTLNYHLKNLIDEIEYPTILVVGLGNQYLTSDAIGPRSMRDLKITHYLDDSDKLEQHLYDISGFTPGVMYQTGFETVDLLKGIVKQEMIDLVIVIDALCTSDYQKIGHVIQLNDIGINPGSGIGNHRKGINQNTLGCKVIGIGVPTVIYASSLVQEVLDLTQGYFSEEMNQASRLMVGKRSVYQNNLSKEHRQNILGQLGLLEKDDLSQLFSEVLNPIDRNYVLSDKQIDEQCEILAKIIARSINDLKY